MIDPTQDSRIAPEVNSLGETHPVLLHLQRVFAEHMQSNPNLTLNGISKKCMVSEPTLRRIVKGQVKTLINSGTLIEILTYLSKETDLQKIIDRYPGPIGEFLKKSYVGLSVSEGIDLHFSETLNRALRDPTKYLVFKLAANSAGVDGEQIKDLFGFHGLALLEELIAEDLVFKQEGVYHSKVKRYSLSNDQFVQNFKVTAAFIKPEKLSQAVQNNLFFNVSGSLTLEAYREIVKIQREALKKCVKIRDAKESQGPIPMFILAAVDTLSHQSAVEIDENVKK